MTTVLFACVHNAGRSQMAAAWFNALADPALARAISAGTQPSERVHAVVVEVMREAGFNLSSVQPTLLSERLAGAAQVLVTMGCGEQCPLVPNLRRIEWNVSDPHGQPIERARTIRDEIRDRVEDLITAEGWRREQKLPTPRAT